MKRIIIMLGAVAAVALPTGNALAQGSAAAAAAAPAAAAPAAKSSLDTGGPSFLDSEMFKQLEADQISFNENGDAVFTGKVVLKGELGIQCSQMRIVNNEILTAKGNPVEIDQPGLQASCQTLVYNMKTKSSKLTGSPVIRQKRGESTLVTKGDTITITQKENGKSAVSVEMDPGSNRRPIIYVEAPEKKAGSKTETGESKTIQSAADIGMKLPGVD